MTMATSDPEYDKAVRDWCMGDPPQTIGKAVADEFYSLPPSYRNKAALERIVNQTIRQRLWGKP